MHRIRLDNTEFEGSNAAYLFDGERTVLVDTGIAIPRIRDQLETGLADHGVAVADLDAILLTHWHFDHAGLVGDFQAESGATVYAHRLDAGLAGKDADELAAMEETRSELFEQWGMPDEYREGLLAFFEAHAGQGGEPADVEPLADGDAVRAGDELLRAVHTPGHTAGHHCYVREEAADAVDGATLLTGDALLPKYTPNVGGADPRVEGALGKYLDTLEWLASGGFERAYPGHRDPIDDPGARAREIVAHHVERSRRVLEYLAASGPADAWSVSAHLFGSLSGIHVLHGPGEAYSHLEHLRDHDLLVREGRAYRPAEGVDPTRELEALFP